MKTIEFGLRGSFFDISISNILDTLSGLNLLGPIVRPLNNICSTLILHVLYNTIHCVCDAIRSRKLPIDE